MEKNNNKANGTQKQISSSLVDKAWESISSNGYLKLVEEDLATKGPGLGMFNVLSIPIQQKKGYNCEYYYAVQHGHTWKHLYENEKIRDVLESYDADKSLFVSVGTYSYEDIVPKSLRYYDLYTHKLMFDSRDNMCLNSEFCANI